MYTLSTTTQKIQLSTSTAALLDYVAAYVTFNTTADSYEPNSVDGQLSSIGDLDIVGSPTGTDKIQVKMMSFTNVDVALSCVVQAEKLISGTTMRKLTPAFTLLIGESIIYVSGQGWIYLSATGAVKAQQTSPGSSNWIMYNSGGVLAGDVNFQFDPVTNTVTIDGTGSNVIIGNSSSEPAAASSGLIKLYQSKISGRQIPKYIGPLGMGMYFQDAIWFKNILRWQAAIAAGVGEAGAFTVAGTNALVAATTTNRYTTMMRSSFASVITTTNQQVGLRSTSSYWMRGSAASQGGFYFCCRFGFQSYKTGTRLFVGMAVTGIAIVTVDPSSLTNILGFAFDLADSAITFMHNDAAGTATKETIAGQPALANNQGYEAYIWCAPNDGTVYYRLVDLNLNTLIIESSVASDLPVNTTALGAVCLMSNGTANIVAGDASLGINKIHVESEI